MTKQLTPTNPAKRDSHLRRRLALCAAVVAVLLIPTSVAHADWYFTKRGAQRSARHFVSHHYANTYASDLTTSCRPSGRRYNPRYVYHRWVCGWYDSRDGTSGTVLVRGGRGSGVYYGRVLHGAH